MNDFWITEEGKTKIGHYTKIPDDEREKEVLNIYTDHRDQEMTGFGGAITDAAGYVFSRMPDDKKQEMLRQYFTPEGMGYTQVRVPLDSCDFSTHSYSADPWEDDEKLERFSFADTERYILPMMRSAEKAAGRRLPLMLAVWSPPAFMKTNGETMHGGRLKKTHYGRWAEYLCRYMEEFKKRGFLVDGCSIQNEPHASQEWESCQFSAEEEKIFLRDWLIPAMKRHHLEDVGVYIWDHNKERVLEFSENVIDEETDPQIAGIACHWYSGDHFEAVRILHREFPSKKIILSENCIEFRYYDRNDESDNAERLAHDMIGNLNSGMTGFFDWNLLLDSRGGPNHKKNYCDAPFLFDEETGVLQKRSCGTAIWHFSHFIHPGAVRLCSSSYTERLEATVWQNPDGARAIVLLNRTEEELPCSIRMVGKEEKSRVLTCITVPPHSLVSMYL